MLCEYLLKNFWEVLANHCLLDVADIDLLEQGFLELNIQNGDQPFKSLFFIEFIVISLNLCSFLASLFYFSYLNTFFTILPLLSLYLVKRIIPEFICWIWIFYVDKPIQNFLATLRHKELYTFSLRKTGVTPKSMMPLRNLRLYYLLHLRNLVNSFNQSSTQFLSSKLEKEKLFSNFIGKEMRELAALDDHRSIDIDDTFLQIHALKNLWQLMFLLRSEFIRISILTLLFDLKIRCNPFEFCSHFYKFLVIIFYKNLVTFNDLGKLKIEKKKNDDDFKKKMNSKASSFTMEQCKARLEWALEMLNTITNANDDTLPCVIDCLEKTTCSLRNINANEAIFEETAKLECNEDLYGELSPIKVDGEVAAFLQESTDEAKQIDYQIFEFSPTTAIEFPVTHRDDKKYEVQLLHENLLCPTADATTAGMIKELTYALTERRKYCQQRELEALTKLQGVSRNYGTKNMNQIPFAETDSSQIRPNELTRSTPRDSPMLNTSNCIDLKSILARKRELFDDQKIEFFGEVNGI